MIHLVIAIIISLMPATAGGQRQESFEGFVNGIRANAVKGAVFYQRGDGKFELEAGHKLQEGDFIKTEPDSYAELLLQPGNYLRIGGESELQILSEPHDKMRLKLNRGSVCIEILARDGEDVSRFYESMSQLFQLIRVITPNAEVFITRSGIFRINTSSAGRTELIARDGEAVLNGRRVKEKRKGVTSNNDVEITEMSSKLEDNFDLWGRERAESLINANHLLKHEAPWAKNQKEDEETSVEVAEEATLSKSHRLVVSARPGTVNFVEAGVEFNHQGKEWEPVTEKSQFEAGDKLRTRAHTFAELMMLPDINLRVDCESEVVFEQLSNDGISMKILKGSAILDVVRFESKELPPITFGGASIADKGNYRIDVKPNGAALTVRDGKVFYKDRYVGGCRTVFGEAVTECDKKSSDNFDFWSVHRGEGALYDGRNVVSMVAHLDRIRRVKSRNTGFWFQNPGKTDYTFVPFSALGFHSPYGGSYSAVLSPRRVPVVRPDVSDRPPFGQYPVPRIARPQP